MILGFLVLGPIPEGIQQVVLSFQCAVEEEAILSQPTIKEEEQEEVVEISDSNDNFEVFNQPPALEAVAGDLNNFPPAQVSQTQEDPIIPDTMVLQCKTRSNLLEIIESQAGGKASKVVGQAKHPSRSLP